MDHIDRRGLKLINLYTTDFYNCYQRGISRQKIKSNLYFRSRNYWYSTLSNLAAFEFFQLVKKKFNEKFKIWVLLAVVGDS